MSILEKAERLLENREDDPISNLKKARDFFIQGRDEDEPASYTGLSETCFWLGEYSSTRDEKETHYRQGVEAGKKAVVLGPEWVDSHLWLAANMGSHGLVKGVMSSLFYIKDMEKHGNLAIEIDEGYFYAAPLRLMGRFYHKCPGWPLGSGDIKKSIQLLEKATVLGPEFILNHVYFAEALVARKRVPEAVELLNQAIAIPAPPKLSIYHQMVCDHAQQLLSSLST